MVETKIVVRLSLGILILSVLAALVSGTSPTDVIVAASVPGSDANSNVVEQTADRFSPLLPQTDSTVYESVGSFETTAYAKMGMWKASVDYQPTTWTPGTRVTTNITLSLSKELLSEIKAASPNSNKICILITAERDFDPSGFQHIPWDYQVSTLLTPGGLPIEGGGMTVHSRFTGSASRTPVDVMLDIPISAFIEGGDASGWSKGTVSASFDLPKSLPPGVYRMRMDFGFKTERTWYTYFGFASEQKWFSLNGDGIGSVAPWEENISCLYSPPITASGMDANGEKIIGSGILKRCYWALLWGYNSNGYQGLVAEEDKNLVAISLRNLIQDEVVLPRTDSNGNAIEYNLEPHFLLDDVYPVRNIPWRYDSGELSIKMTLPNGTAVDLWSSKVKIPIPNGTKLDLGTSKFVAKGWNGPTTKNPVFTSWKPPADGRYTVEAKGWIEDKYGNRYYGGGNYSFWIAKRLTIATSTFQGQSYIVGNRYGRDLAFSPAVPADVKIEANLYVNSDPKMSKRQFLQEKRHLGGYSEQPRA